MASKKMRKESDQSGLKAAAVMDTYSSIGAGTDPMEAHAIPLPALPRAMGGRRAASARSNSAEGDRRAEGCIFAAVAIWDCGMTDRADGRCKSRRDRGRRRQRVFYGDRVQLSTAPDGQEDRLPRLSVSMGHEQDIHAEEQGG